MYSAFTMFLKKFNCTKVLSTVGQNNFVRQICDNWPSKPAGEFFFMAGKVEKLKKISEKSSLELCKSCSERPESLLIEKKKKESLLETHVEQGSLWNLFYIRSIPITSQHVWK